MASSIYEYEIKLLGSRQSLKEASEKFINLSRFVNPARGYIFDTKYYDTEDGYFSKRGYSLRYRPQQGNFGSCFEIKQLAGNEDGMSKRLEVGVRQNIDRLSLYFNLLAHKDFPKDLQDIPKFSQLSEIYSTVVERVEQESVLSIDEIPYIIELALDNIQFVKDGIILAEESELEFEVKSGQVDCKKLMDWFKQNIVDGMPIDFTVDSKATRLRKLLDMALEVR